jgi:hypothetical protein
MTEGKWRIYDYVLNAVNTGKVLPVAPREMSPNQIEELKKLVQIGMRYGEENRHGEITEIAQNVGALTAAFNRKNSIDVSNAVEKSRRDIEIIFGDQANTIIGALAAIFVPDKDMSQDIWTRPIQRS